MTKPILKYYDLAEGVVAFSSTRMGGVSEGSFGEFNINEFCGDEASHIAENRKGLAAELNIEDKNIVMPHQVHGLDSRIIADEYFTFPDNIRKMIVDNVDCVMTDMRGVCIGVSTADCIPVLLYDEEHHAVAAVHAGWRGTLNRIVHKSVVDMSKAYTTDASKLKAVIGPGISLDGFEVGQEVYDQFQQTGFDMSRIAKMYDKWHIDLPLCNKIQLMEAGVPESCIQMSGICTYTHSEEYFSARKLGAQSGRIFTGIMDKI